ncbi:TonB-dependent receptor [Acidipila sp. EB88]|uniref:TonB-dependent receptor n=1 Tax=Acidipila sp. EB88 TaxID=2305226 RepID=UPI000F5FA723|nr:TonB-dependent receptor [Acidipila sp. EB88]RRA48154.1 TonB-dependent receptor [Acidipila sp. EB88]
MKPFQSEDLSLNRPHPSTDSANSRFPARPFWLLASLGIAACMALPAQQPAGQPAPSTPATDTVTQQVDVLAFRSPVAALDSPTSSRVLTDTQLQRASSIGLDGKLRTIPGFDLFRRSSSLVANPTTEGVSLRGLGSTAASRTLVLLGDVPLNDPYGGWVHWEEIPSLAIGQIEVARGGVSDLYGSSAVGGAVQITTQPLFLPTGTSPFPRPELVLESGYGAEALNDNGARLRASSGRWSSLTAAELIGTDGYTLVAPNLRGPVDVNSNVHAENALVLLQRTLGEAGSGDAVWLRGNVLNELRHNGTPLTNNATRLWRYAAGLDRQQWGSDWQLRGWGSTEHFRQNFSSVATGRASETLTRNANNPADELGAALRWKRALATSLVALAGADVRDIRAEDIERPTSSATPATSTTARQTDEGAYGELLWTPGPWLLSGSARLDHFQNVDAATYTLATGTRAPQPSIVQTIFDPRLGISRRFGNGLAVSASGYRAYRAPTENELYRTGQVGQQTTLANPSLRAERTTGWETGVSGQSIRRLGASWRASYFWSEVNRPITALTLKTTPTATTLMRENLGQLRSRGVSFDGTLHPASWLELAGGYQFARATVTRFVPEPQLVGLWIPQVPRNTGTLQLTASQRRIGLLSLQLRSSGHQYDDDANTYILHSFTRVDVYASHTFHQRWEVYGSVENLLDRSIDVGRTPIRTLGTPQLARFGTRITLGGVH